MKSWGTRCCECARAGVFSGLILLMVFAASAGAANIRVVSMGAHGVALEVNVPPWELESVVGPDGLYQRVRLPGWGRTVRTGHPELPVKGCLLAVPAGGDMEVSAVVVESRVVKGVQPWPVARLAVGPQGETVERFVKDEAAYRSESWIPAKLVRLSEREMFRGTPVARVMLRPFQWHSAGGRLRCVQRQRVRVRFQEALNAERPGARGAYGDLWAQIKDAILLNAGWSGAAGDTVPGNDPEKVENQGNSAMFLARTALRIQVASEGMHRLSYEDLISAGLPSGIDVRTFQLFNGGVETAIRVRAAGVSLGPGAFIEFYGEALDTQFSDANVYWLRWGKEPGLRMETVDGSVSGEGTPASTFRETRRGEENHVVWDGTPGAPETDYWFWEKMSAPQTLTCKVALPAPVPEASDGLLRVWYQGRSTAAPHPNHHTIVSLNGAPAADAFWDGDEPFVQEAAFPSEWLLEGENQVRIEAPGDTDAPVDIFYPNWVEISYERFLKARDNRLEFSVTGPGIKEVRVRAFADDDISVFDVTDPLKVRRVHPISVEPDAGKFKAVFDVRTDDNENRYHAVSAAGLRVPACMEMWESPNLSSPDNGADWIVITPRAFLPAAAPLTSLRRSQGLRVMAVAVEDLYNEFNHGLFDPIAIKNFLECAYENWTPPAPTHVFLVGDATLDYRDYWETGKRNRVPPHMVRIDLLIPSDNWYACVDGPADILPDMFIGRIPGSNVEMVEQEIAKIIEFDQTPWPASEQVLLAADDNETAFEEVSESLIPYLPEGFAVNRVYLGDYAHVSDATRDIIENLDQGMILANYVGHGSVTNWSGEFLFDTEDIPFLSNADRLTFVSAMTCLNGYFCQPHRYCLGEAFAAGDRRGAVGALAPGGLGYTWAHEILDAQLFQAVFQHRNSVIGAAAAQAKIAGYGEGLPGDMVEMFNLFGDPAVRLKIAQNDAVLPDIRANGWDGPAAVETGEVVDVTLSLKSGAHAGEACDWWVGAGTTFGAFWYAPGQGWKPSSAPVSAGEFPIMALPATSVLKMPLPLGMYTFSFGLDTRPDGMLNRLDWLDVVTVISGARSNVPEDVVPEIRADGEQGKLVVTPSEAVQVEVFLNAGTHGGLNCDWWVGADTPWGTFWYDLGGGWALSETARVTATAPLFDLSSKGVFEGRLPWGAYGFFFILDQNPNGILDDISWYDVVNVVCVN